MEKIKRKPIETFKTVIIALLTVSMLILASVYIGGAQFSPTSSAINSSDMPIGAVSVGSEVPDRREIFEKNLMLPSFIGIRYGDIGGGAYSTEQAAHDLLEFAAEPLHYLLSSAATVSASDKEQFESALAGSRYICTSLISPLPYQIIYLLSGEYVAPLRSDDAINPDVLLLSFAEDGKTALYMRDGERYFLSQGDFTVKASEITAMASDTRLYDFTVTDGIPLSESSPLVQTLTLSIPSGLVNEEFDRILALLDYDNTSSVADTYTAVAPHGTLRASSKSIVYSAANEGGVLVSAFLDRAKSELDIGFQDVLLSAVSLIESIRAASPTMAGGTLDVYLDGVYRKDDTYTVIFGLAEDSIPISGKEFPFFAKITVQGGKFKSVELNLLTSERSGYAYSPFSSAWEYRYASKQANIRAIMLRYNIASLPTDDIGAAWYYRGERTVEQ